MKEGFYREWWTVEMVLGSEEEGSSERCYAIFTAAALIIILIFSLLL